MTEDRFRRMHKNDPVEVLRFHLAGLARRVSEHDREAEEGANWLRKLIAERTELEDEGLADEDGV
jgi:hypothetical protein